MLELYANKKRLQLPEDISVDMTWENPFLLQDRIPAPYSMSFTLPGTKENYAAFGNPQRLNSTGIKKEIASNALFNSVTFLMGKLNFQEVEKKLKLNFQGDQLPGAVRKKLSDITMDHFNFGDGSRFFPDFNSGWAKLYKETIFNNAITNDKFACCPIRIEDEEWPYDDPGAFGNYAATKLYFNFFNVVDGDYLMKGGATNIHTAIFPQPYVHHLLDIIFGDSLAANPFKTDSELKTLVMATTFHKLFTDSLMSSYKGILLDNTYQTSPNHFYLNSFLNSFAFNDFLKDLLKIFCFSLMPRSDGKWDIIHNKEILESTEVEDWSDKLVGTPTISYEAGQTYTYGYSDHGETNEEEGSGVELDHINALLAANAGTYRIKSTGEVYEKKLKSKENEEDPDEFEYKLKKSGLGGSTEGDDTYSMVSSVAPMPMGIAEYWTENSYNGGIPKSPWYVPFFTNDRNENNFAPFIGFNRGWIKTADGKLDNTGTYSNHYPFLSPFDKDLSGAQNSNYSLAWEGPNGLIEKFHKEFKTYIEKDKMVLKGNFRLSELDLKNMKYQRKKYIRGKKFFLRKVEGTLQKRRIGLVKCELIEA